MSKYEEKREQAQQAFRSADEESALGSQFLSQGKLYSAHQKFQKAASELVRAAALVQYAMVEREGEREAEEALWRERAKQAAGDSGIKSVDPETGEVELKPGYKAVPEPREDPGEVIPTYKPWREADKPVEFEDETFGAGPNA